MKIEKAHISDADDLTALTIRSKSHWNYSLEQIELWKDDLTVTESFLLENQVFKLMHNSQLVGYYAFFSLKSAEAKLDSLFVEPDFIGQGYGKVLMNDFLDRVKAQGYKRIVLDADPNVEPFYTHFGFVVIGKLKTAVKNRFLPIMELKISPKLKG